MPCGYSEKSEPSKGNDGMDDQIMDKLVLPDSTAMKTETWDIAPQQRKIFCNRWTKDLNKIYSTTGFSLITSSPVQIDLLSCQSKRCSTSVHPWLTVPEEPKAKVFFHI